jgi:DNA-binding NarL/FixJ family response regulator
VASRWRANEDERLRRGYRAGKSLATIARHLRRSAEQERHRANILEKLGIRDCVELTRHAIRRGLVEP